MTPKFASYRNEARCYRIAYLNNSDKAADHCLFFSQPPIVCTACYIVVSYLGACVARAKRLVKTRPPPSAAVIRVGIFLAAENRHTILPLRPFFIPPPHPPPSPFAVFRARIQAAASGRRRELRRRRHTVGRSLASRKVGSQRAAV